MSAARTRLGAQMFIHRPLSVFPDSAANPDLSTPDDKTVVYPIPRDAKVDVAVFLKLGLAQFGNPLGQIPVIRDGSFQASLLRMYDVTSQTDLAHAKTTPRPVIQVARASDVARRLAVNEGSLVSQKTSQGGNIVTNSESVPEESHILTKDQVSDVTVEINIYATVETLADQLYLIVKTLMFEAEQVFMAELGYLNVLRKDGVDNAGLTMDVPGGEALIFVRTLTYLCTHLDFIAGINQLAALYGQSQTLYDADGNPVTVQSEFP